MSAGTWRDAVRLARPDHWFKNVLALPGVVLAWALAGGAPGATAWRVVLVVGALCAVASANYALNEWLDRDRDRHHPGTRARPAAAGRTGVGAVAAVYAGGVTAGVVLAAGAGERVVTLAVVFALLGAIYNVPPVRAKDRPVLDVLVESLNNPVRFAAGWFAVTPSPAPPSSALLGTWMAGAYLMSVKRLAERRALGADEAVRRYRPALARFSEESLLVAIVFYAAAAAFFLGVFLVKYRVEFVLGLPPLAALFAWYLRIGLAPASPAQRPETLWRETRFALAAVAVGAIFVVLSLVDIPPLRWLLESAFVSR